MSFLESINIGKRGRREPHNLSGITTTTTEIGYFQPTYCRYVVADSKIRINAKSICRLSPVAVPTVGQISLRNYFYFIDLATLWTPFDAMRESTNYRYGDGSVSTPRAIPTFQLRDFFTSVLKYNAGVSVAGVKEFRDSIVFTVYKNGALATGIDAVFADILGNHSVDLPFTPYIIRNTVCYEKSQETLTTCKYQTRRADLDDVLPVVTNQNADFAWYARGASDTYHILGKFTGFSKRVRKMFIGCGYSFNPFDTSKQTLLKLFAVYKSWYDTMAVQRDKNFNNTYCYNLIKYLSENAPSTYSIDSNTGKYYCDLYNSTFYPSTSDTLVNSFICSLADLCYNLPPDYFSASDTTSARGTFEDNLHSIDVLNSVNGDKTSFAGTFAGNNPVYGINNGVGVSAHQIDLISVFQKLVNKRSIIGRKIQDLLAINGEKDIHNNEHETVHHLGVDRTNIDINPIFSQSSTQDASLGDYAAVGYGAGDTDTYVYDTKTYGILLCLSSVVPVSGYFQGILHENGDSNPFDFFKSDFDAMGYQGLAVNELISDLQFQNSSMNSVFGTELGYFGIVPRYQHLKVGRNICNGDISIPSMQPVMLPYTFDRHFITCKPVGTVDSFGEVQLPSNSPESFRQVKANDAYGDYNRIFQYVGSDYDHFILHFNFNVQVMSPMKSVANSYDTFQISDDDKLTFNHE